MEKEWLSDEELAQFLGCKNAHGVRHMRRMGRAPKSTKLVGHRVTHREELNRWLREHFGLPAEAA